MGGFLRDAYCVRRSRSDEARRDDGEGALDGRELHGTRLLPLVSRRDGSRYKIPEPESTGFPRPTPLPASRLNRRSKRAGALAALRQVEEFASLVVGDRRVIAPGHGLDARLFPADCFAPCIDEVWSTYTGRVRGGQLVFTGPAQVSFARPSTRDVLFCHGALAAPDDGTTGPVAAVLGAGFNRSTPVSTAAQPTTDPASFHRTALTTLTLTPFQSRLGVRGRAGRSSVVV
jgi:hypothetical protein